MEKFDWNSYKNEYEDLSGLIVTKQQAWNHYWRHGKNEGRKFFTYESISKDFFEENYTIYITRHISNDLTNNYWLHNYNHLRELYKKIKIVVIDDNSCDEFLHNDNLYKHDVDFIYTKDTVNKSSGEIIPLIEHFKNGTTKYAFYIHDSVFIQHEIHNLIYETEFIALWSFNSINWIQKLEKNIDKLLKELNNYDELKHIQNNWREWDGVFGGMCIVSNDFLLKLEELKFFSLSNCINNRDDRMSYERILAIIHHYLYNKRIDTSFGNIHQWSISVYKRPWGLNWQKYYNNKEYENEPIIKIWSGR